MLRVELYETAKLIGNSVKLSYDGVVGFDCATKWWRAAWIIVCVQLTEPLDDAFCEHIIRITKEVPEINVFSLNKSAWSLTNKGLREFALPCCRYVSAPKCVSNITPKITDSAGPADVVCTHSLNDLCARGPIKYVGVRMNVGDRDSLGELDRFRVKGLC
jgi:hypothetical protein